jgi:hypothetical protein
MIDYYGYIDCPVLENKHTRVVLTVHGGRVLEYSLSGKNSLYLDPEGAGMTYLPNKESHGSFGARFDIGPEYTIPEHPELWLGEWHVEHADSRSVRMMSNRDCSTGLKLIREFVLQGESSHLLVTQTICNESEEQQNCCHWSRTFGLGGGKVIIPLSCSSRFPKSYVMYGPGSVIEYQPYDPAIRVRDGFLEIVEKPARPKLGMDSYAGWFAYLERNDLLFVKRFPVFPDRVYGEIAGLTLSIYYCEDSLCELEPIGPLERLQPGESASFTEEWFLQDYPFPGEEEVDLSELTHLVKGLEGW